MTGRNPNVFYEVGYAHALGKTVILTKDASDIPFDLKYRYHLAYDSINALRDELQKRVRYYLKHSTEASSDAIFGMREPRPWPRGAVPARGSGLSRGAWSEAGSRTANSQPRPRPALAAETRPPCFGLSAPGKLRSDPAPPAYPPPRASLFSACDGPVDGRSYRLRRGHLWPSGRDTDPPETPRTLGVWRATTLSEAGGSPGGFGAIRGPMRPPPRQRAWGRSCRAGG
jgi:hypothetical protein